MLFLIPKKRKIDFVCEWYNFQINEAQKEDQRFDCTTLDYQVRYTPMYSPLLLMWQNALSKTIRDPKILCLSNAIDVFLDNR